MLINLLKCVCLSGTSLYTIVFRNLIRRVDDRFLELWFLRLREMLVVYFTLQVLYECQPIYYLVLPWLFSGNINKIFKRDNTISKYSFLKKLFYFLRLYLFIFQRGEGKEKERERNISVGLPLACCLLGTWPETQACALTGNRTGDPLISRLTLKSTEAHQPGHQNILEYTNLYL